jgi:hypothetical protein
MRTTRIVSMDNPVRQQLYSDAMAQGFSFLSPQASSLVVFKLRFKGAKT